MSLDRANTKKLWNPLLGNYESWEVSELDLRGSDSEILETTLNGMQLTHRQIQQGFFPIPERIAFLERFKEEFTKSFDNLVQILAMELQKPVGLGRVECSRAKDTLQATLDWGYEILKNYPQRKILDENYIAASAPEGRGISLAVTPFNFPINLALHKILPAILAGSPLLWRPSPKAQLSSLALLDCLHAAKLPPGLLAFVPMTNDSFWKVIEDPRIASLSFTGSEALGWKIHSLFKGATILELGGCAPLWIDEDIDPLKLDSICNEIVASAFSFAGQSCISAQNLFIPPSLYEKTKKILIEKTQDFATGNAWEEKTLCSGVIDDLSQKRIFELISLAQKEGSTLYQQEFSAQKDSQYQNKLNFVPPTLIENSPAALIQEEVFAPLLNLIRVDSLDQFILQANSMKSRLQAAVYSDNPEILSKAAMQLQYGGVAMNISTSTRVDALPYGGRGLSGVGAEDPQSTWAFYSPHKTIYRKK